MAEISVDGYQSLREFLVSESTIPSEWDYLALYDSNKTEWGRLSVTSDSRLSWEDIDGDPIVAINAVLSGDDGDISLPQTFEYAAIWDAASGGRRMTQIEQFPKRTFDKAGDKLDLTHTIEIPTQS